ncbi:hypothetical protein V1264_016053 [Littorina saxatilis]|uniref:KCTD1_15 n=1 Tax=Littorina saxatilis TaxID=31220 RepID=A0AAN9BL36_9CAEN
MEQQTPKKRFATFTRKDIAEKKSKLTPASTKNANASAARLFSTFLKAKGENINFEEYSIEELDTALSDAYLGLRTEKGELYRGKSLEGFRAGLSRYLKSAPQNKTFDIIKDVEFCQSTESYKVAMGEIKEAGKGDIRHTKTICEADRIKMKNSLHLSPHTPVGLANKIQFDIRLYFFRRGGENMDQMTKDTFAIKRDENTHRRFVIKVKDELTKNHRGGDEEFFSGIMPDTGDEFCPVQSFERYIHFLHPNCNRLFQYPKASFLNDDTCWYQNKPIGLHCLRNFMPTLSRLCQLSDNYTNYCIRATGATILAENSFGVADIMSVTGHKSVSSLAIYQRTSQNLFTLLIPLTPSGA